MGLVELYSTTRYIVRISMSMLLAYSVYSTAFRFSGRILALEHLRWKHAAKVMKLVMTKSWRISAAWMRERPVSC